MPGAPSRQLNIIPRKHVLQAKEWGRLRDPYASLAPASSRAPTMLERPGLSFGADESTVVDIEVTPDFAPRSGRIEEEVTQSGSMLARLPKTPLRRPRLFRWTLAFAFAVVVYADNLLGLSNAAQSITSRIVAVAG